MDIQAIVDDPCVRLGVNCHGCGILRLIPESTKIGDIFRLMVCPKCGILPLVLRLTADGFEEVIH